MQDKSIKRSVKDVKTEQKIKKSKNTSMFMLAKEGDKVIIVMGNYKASEKTFDTFEQADEYIATKPYELILNMCLIHKQYEKIYEEQNKKNVAKDA